MAPIEPTTYDAEAQGLNLCYARVAEGDTISEVNSDHEHLVLHNQDETSSCI